MIELNDKQKLAIYKKSITSGYSTGILEEVYRRGYQIWDESFTGNAEQFGFDRVNSFIAGGFAAQLDADLIEGKTGPGLWANIHAKRERIKHGSGEHMRKPGSKGAPTAANFKAAANESLQEKMYKTGETVELQSTDPNKPEGRFDSTEQAERSYASKTPGQSGRDLHNNTDKKSPTLKTIKKLVKDKRGMK